MTDPNIIAWLQNLNALVGGLFLLATFGLVAMRQVDACLRLFVALSIFLAASAFLLSALFQNWHLTVVGVVDILTKAIQADAREHSAYLHRLSKGVPRVLEKLLIELATRKYKIDSSFGRHLLDLDRRIREIAR
jgi:hypothetical protein